MNSSQIVFQKRSIFPSVCGWCGLCGYAESGSAPVLLELGLGRANSHIAARYPVNISLGTPCAPTPRRNTSIRLSAVWLREYFQGRECNREMIVDDPIMVGITTRP